MYSKATYVKPYIRKFIRVLGINNVGTLNKPKMNVIYAILANNGIKPIDKNQYGVISHLFVLEKFFRCC